MAHSFYFNLKKDRWGDSGEIKWRFNCHSLVGSGRSREDPLSSSLLEKKSIHALSVYGWLFFEHRLKFSLDVKNGAPNNASSQTKNYEITYRDFYSRVTEGSYYSSLFLLFLEVRRKQQSIFF
ncbi:hypothetical protein Mapa_018071 [Marchantia paleacea]|nr:hypothetical protein Mapa_018071 [Marchantia paleacea]